MRELQAIISTLAAAKFEVAALIVAGVVIGLVAWALITLVKQSGKQTDAMTRQADAMIETQRLHNETERRRNEERKEEAEQLKEVIKLSDTQQKKIDELEDHVASAQAAAGGAIKQVQELSKANDTLTAELKSVKEAAELRDAEYKRRQEEADLKIAEANLKITMLENQREIDNKLIEQLKADLGKAHAENLTALKTIQSANVQSENAAIAWRERFDLQTREITGLQARVKQLEQLAEERQAARDEARKERDEEVLKVAALNDTNNTLKQQINEMSKRVRRIEVATGPLMSPGKSQSGA